MAEYLPAEGALLDLGDVAGSALRVRDVLASDDAKGAIVEAIELAGRELTWSATADAYIDIYRRSMTRPVGLSLVVGREVIVAAPAQVIATDTERRVVLALRRNATVRRIMQVVVSVVAALRRAARRVKHGMSP